MRAIVLDHFGGLDSLVIKDIPEPEPMPGHVVIQIKAFGINHAEMHMRRGEWAEAAPVSGIECVGIVKSCPGGEFAVGSRVAALMGGLGRTINGSYAEYTRATVGGVARIESDLPWEELAALPGREFSEKSRSGRARGISGKRKKLHGEPAGAGVASGAGPRHHPDPGNEAAQISGR